jgi:glucose-6-phosphate 1-dehydrogenase
MSVTTIIVLGASGDLAKKKTFPALFDLYLAGLLPPRAAALAAPSPKPGAGDASISAPALHLWGYARSAMTDAAFRAWLRPALVGDGSDASALDAARDAFLGLCRYQQGGYGDEAAMRALDGKLVADEVASGAAAANRLFYLAVPPTVFPEAAATVKRALVVGAGAGAGARARGWSRVVVEKPFGRDSASSAALAAELAKHFDEAQVYRIDVRGEEEDGASRARARAASAQPPRTPRRAALRCRPPPITLAALPGQGDGAEFDGAALRQRRV